MASQMQAAVSLPFVKTYHTVYINNNTTYAKVKDCTSEGSTSTSRVQTLEQFQAKFRLLGKVLMMR